LDAVAVRSSAAATSTNLDFANLQVPGRDFACACMHFSMVESPKTSSAACADSQVHAAEEICRNLTWHPGVRASVAASPAETSEDE
jgi:hypothetical protein